MTQPSPAVNSWDETLRQAFVQPRQAAAKFAQDMPIPADAWAFLGQLQAAADEAVQYWPQRTEHACAAGCFFCCFLWIDAMPLEVLRIADYLQRKTSPSELAEVRRRLRERLSAPSGERPCGLLTADGCCGVYAVRPVTCRGFHSFSRSSCQAAFEGHSRGPTAGLDEPLHMLIAAMQEGIERGLAEHGFESGWVELNEALLYVLDLPNPLISWLCRQPIFPSL